MPLHRLDENRHKRLEPFAAIQSEIPKPISTPHAPLRHKSCVLGEEPIAGVCLASAGAARACGASLSTATNSSRIRPFSKRPLQAYGPVLLPQVRPVSSCSPASYPPMPPDAQKEQIRSGNRFIFSSISGEAMRQRQLIAAGGFPIMMTDHRSRIVDSISRADRHGRTFLAAASSAASRSWGAARVSEIRRGKLTATGGEEMTIDEGRKPEGAPERSPKAGEGVSRASKEIGRSVFPFSARWP